MDNPTKKPLFTHYKAYEKLQTLAKKPFDLTLPGNLTPARIEHYCSESCGFKLLYATERITDEVMSAFIDLVNESQALVKMQRMQAGDIINYIDGYPSEKRAVLHTATRDFFKKQNPSKKAKEAAQLAKNEVEKLRAFIDKLDREKRFTDMVMIGIGGSDLGPRAHYLALQHFLKRGRRVHFISNIDPDDASTVLRHVNLSKTLVVVVSKTGTTLETFSNEEFVREKFKKEGLKPEEHFVSVTCPNTPMDDPKRYMATFHLWEWVGGRYCTTSMAGGVMLSFAFGIDVYLEFLEGANAMDKAALQSDLQQNLPLLAALLAVWNRNFLHYPTTALIPYSQALSRFPAHIQQVEMESNGKRIDQHGNALDFQTAPVIWGEPGTNGQHSFYQMIHQGTDIVPLEFIAFAESQCHDDLEVLGTTLQQKLLANVFAQMLALATGQNSENPNKVFPGNRPSHLLLGQCLTPFALGALLSFFEHRAAFQGFIWDINSFDQEGVQLGKALANRILDLFLTKKGTPPQSVTPFPLGEALLKHLNLSQ